MAYQSEKLEQGIRLSISVGVFVVGRRAPTTKQKFSPSLHEMDEEVSGIAVCGNVASNGEEDYSDTEPRR